MTEKIEERIAVQRLGPNDLPDKTYYSSATVPWDKSEFLYYRGFPLVYTMKRGANTIVHFPAGLNVDIHSLDRRELIEPKNWRREVKI